MKSIPKQTGFTLVEMLITVGIAALLLASAVPSLQEIFYKNSSLSYSNDLRVALYRAQNEAVRRNRKITVQAKTSNNQYWEGGWNIFLDTDNDNTLDAGEELISTYVPRTTNQTLKSKNASFGSAISFDPFGLPLGSSGSTNGEFWICRPDNNSTLSHTVKVDYSGYISVKTGATCS